MPYILDHDAIAILDGCLPLLSNVLGSAVSSPDDTEPNNTPRLSESREENPFVSEQLPSDTSTATTGQPPTSQNVSPEYGPSHPRRSKRPRKPRKLFVNLTIFLPHRGGVKSGVLELSLVCKFATISTTLIATLFLPTNDLFHAARCFVLRALYLVVGS